jgi:hypothetical protein
MAMSETPRSSSRLAASAVLLLCAGAGAWFYLNSGAEPQKTAVAVQAEAEKPAAVMKAAVEAEKPAAAVKAAVEEEKPVVAESSAHQVAASLNSGPRQPVLTQEEKVEARVDEALASKDEPMAGGDSAGGSLTQSEAKPVEERQDPVVTRRFAGDLAGWLVASYTPPAKGEGKGRSSASLRAANARYSSSSLLRSVESDTLKGRASILRYVYSPGMLEALYRMYGPRFMDELEAEARDGRRSFSPEQTSGMFKVYAELLERTASALDAASRTDIKALVKPIRKAAASEDAASEAFAKAYAAHAEARETGRKDIMAEQSERMAQSARTASESNAREESARLAAASALRQKAAGPTLSDADLVFLAEWLARRNASSEASASAASICRRMAGDLRSRAATMPAPVE